MIHYDIIYVNGTGSQLRAIAQMCEDLRVAWGKHNALFEPVLRPERVSRMALVGAMHRKDWTHDRPIP